MVCTFAITYIHELLLPKMLLLLLFTHTNFIQTSFALLLLIAFGLYLHFTIFLSVKCVSLLNLFAFAIDKIISAKSRGLRFQDQT